MSASFNLQNMTQQLNQKVTRETIKITNNLKDKLSVIVDYEEEFEKIFKTYQEKQLPKDELYYKIKQEQDAKEAEMNAKKSVQEQLTRGKKLLPRIHDNKTDEIMHSIHQKDVAREMRETEGQNEVSDQIKTASTRALIELQKHKNFFTGDFEKLDNEIKCQVKALINNDFETLEKIQK